MLVFCALLCMAATFNQFLLLQSAHHSAVNLQAFEFCFVPGYTQTVTSVIKHSGLEE